MRNGNMLRVRAGVRVRVMTRASVGIVVRFHFAVVLFNFFTVWLGAISPNLQFGALNDIDQIWSKCTLEPFCYNRVLHDSSLN